MKFVEKEIDGDIIRLPELKEGDIVSLVFDDREDLDLAEFLDHYKGDLIVEGFEYESQLFWLKDCDYSINMAWISNVERPNENDIWVITLVNINNQTLEEFNTTLAENFNEALSRFKSLLDKYVAREKEYFVDCFNLETGLSLCEYRDIIAQDGDTVNYGYRESNNEKLFTVDKKFGSNIEETIIRMYKLDGSKNDSYTSGTLYHNVYIDTIIENIKCVEEV